MVIDATFCMVSLNNIGINFMLKINDELSSCWIIHLMLKIVHLYCIYILHHCILFLTVFFKGTHKAKSTVTE